MSLVQRYEKHENQMKVCAAELIVSDWQMIALKAMGAHYRPGVSN